MRVCRRWTRALPLSDRPQNRARFRVGTHLPDKRSRAPLIADTATATANRARAARRRGPIPAFRAHAASRERR